MGQGRVSESSIANSQPGSLEEALSSRTTGALILPTTNPDTDYISAEELAQVEQMLAHLTAASAQAAAASLVSGVQQRHVPF